MLVKGRASSDLQTMGLQGTMQMRRRKGGFSELKDWDPAGITWMRFERKKEEKKDR
jgi:hypothetical protein